jgi:subtilase family serine protease
MSHRKLTMLAATAGSAVVLALLGAPASNAATRLGVVPRLPSGASVSGLLPEATPMNVTIALRPRDPAGLQSFATDVSTPGSSIYGQYLTPAQFAARFGPTPSQISEVQSSLRAHGLAPGPVSPNGLSIPVSATAGRVEHAFALSLARVTLPGARAAIANSVAPLLDANIAGVVQSVVGLDTLAHPRPLIQRSAVPAARPHATPHVVTGGPQPCPAVQAAQATQGGFTTDQIASAYGLPGLYITGDQGAGQTIVLYELEPYDPSDVAAFQACYGTHAPILNIPVDGGAGGGPGAGEAALDIEQAIGFAHGANIVVYEGPNSTLTGPGSGYYDTWNAIVSQDRGQVVSASWGQCEALEPVADAQALGNLFAEAAAQGQTVVTASGDEGSEGCNNPPGEGPADNALAVDDPASQPFVTGVGGTSLESPGPRPVEQVWNNGGSFLASLSGAGASGGGLSSRWRMPSYQSGAPASLHVVQGFSSSAFCGGGPGYCRQVPDVSANSDPVTPYLIYWNGSGSDRRFPRGWQGIGGTSGATPLWGAVFALANASGACQGLRIGFANPSLYNAAATSYSAAFNDISVGNNDFTGSNAGRYPGGAGYDMATGLGSPNAAGLAGAMCVHAVQTRLVRPPTISGVSLSGVRRARPRLQLTVTAGQNAPAVKRLAIRLPRPLRFGRKPRAITVTGPNRHRASFSWSLRRGVLTITLKSSKSQVKVTINYAAITATASEVTAARRRRARKLRFNFTVSDAKWHPTSLTASLKPRN